MPGAQIFAGMSYGQPMIPPRSSHRSRKQKALAHLTLVSSSRLPSPSTACAVGDGTSAAVKLKSKASPKHIASGKVVRYGVRLCNTNKGAAVTNLALVMRLPVPLGVAKTSKGYLAVPQAHKAGWGAVYQRADLPMPLVNATYNTVTWGGLELPPRKSVDFMVEVRALNGLPKGTALTFSSSVYQVRSMTGFIWPPRRHPPLPQTVIHLHPLTGAARERPALLPDGALQLDRLGQEVSPGRVLIQIYYLTTYIRIRGTVAIDY